MSICSDIKACSTVNWHTLSFPSRMSDYLEEKKKSEQYSIGVSDVDERGDVFGNEEDRDIQYKTLSWPFVSLLMIAQIVSNGILAFPNAVAVKDKHCSCTYPQYEPPGVHNVGDAGYIIFVPIGKEVLSIGTIVFAIFGTVRFIPAHIPTCSHTCAGSVLLSGQQALSTLSDKGLCALVLLLILSAATFLLALPRTLGRLSWLGLFSVMLISLYGILAMIGAGVGPTPGRIVVPTSPSNFYQAFLAITSPVFAYAVKTSLHMLRPSFSHNPAGHFIYGISKFFMLIAEMRQPQDAMKASAAWVLQVFATVSYAIFSVVVYVYIRSTVASPALLSLQPIWSKVSFAVGLALELYMHTRRPNSCSSDASDVLAISTPTPSSVGLSARFSSVFASWYTVPTLAPLHCRPDQMTAITELHSIPISARPRTWAQALHCVVFLVVFISGCLMINASQFVVLLPLTLLPFPWARKMFYEGIRYSKGAFGTLIVLVSQLFAPTTLVVSFEKDGPGKFTDEEVASLVERDAGGRVVAVHLPQKAVLIANHQIYADWWYAWCLTYFMGTHKDVYIVLKNSLKWVPVVGWGMQFYNFIFLARSWASDRLHLSQSLSWLARRAEKEDSPLTFILYPEGTLVSADTRPVSKKYADKLGIPDMVHTLLPRSTGLHYSLRSLAPRIPNLHMIDITVAYPGIPPLGYGQSHYTLRSIFLDGVPPPTVHMHIRRFHVGSQVPIGDISASKGNALPNGFALSVHSVEVEVPELEREKFDVWLRDLWREKDKLMTKYLDTGSFVDAPLLKDRAREEFEIPLKLKHAYEVLDAFYFFVPAVVGWAYSKLLQ
ncbi:putative acyltransferase CST26 [Grifola frondosa]|uniref:Putative acyltransferase CST26 n=1 Tax=Grifola frondosa TaxID=5627 RepID=A0A1C7MPH7_GRIFR|nr:putative acyltransferase CST26 [Grifola frondosa]